MSELSKRQHRRFCGLLSVANSRLPYDEIMEELELDGFVQDNQLTDSGHNELMRLATIQGFNVEKDRLY